MARDRNQATMRRRSTRVWTLAAAAWLIAAPPAFASTISAPRLAGALPEASGGAPLYSHDSSNAGLALLGSANDWAAAHHSLFGIQLLDTRASFVIGIGATADSDVMRAFKAEDTRLIQESDRGHNVEPAAPVAFQVLPAVEWREEPVVDRDLTNIAAQPIPTMSVDPSGLVGTVIVSTPLTSADADVPPPLEPVVQGGVVALNLMMEAAVSLFERVSSFLHKFFFVGPEPQPPAV